MSLEEKEFVELKKRFHQAQVYEKTQYQSDTPEGKKWAENEMKKIVERLSELWNLLTDDEKQRNMDVFDL